MIFCLKSAPVHSIINNKIERAWVIAHPCGQPSATGGGPGRSGEHALHDARSVAGRGEGPERQCSQGKRFCHAGGELYRSQQLFCPASRWPHPQVILLKSYPQTRRTLEAISSLLACWLNVGHLGGAAKRHRGARLPRAMT